MPWNKRTQPTAIFRQTNSIDCRFPPPTSLSLCDCCNKQKQKMMMLAACRRAVRQPGLVQAVARQGRCFTASADESHSDFARQSKLETTEAESVNAFIQNTIDSNPVTLFMKGTPEYPQCGFSKQESCGSYRCQHAVLWAVGCSPIMRGADLVVTYFFLYHG